ncbi:hypothetical protein AB0C76_17825 [Kitasatospora sp. NPDC048722]|uniref:hypothetical protein n=1 Tax=Kitasatospora sp. NPDC048722 TaxID=3155639 RepID=UPI00340CC912
METVVEGVGRRAVERAFGAPVLTAVLVQPALALGLYGYRYGMRDVRGACLTTGAPALLILLVRCARRNAGQRLLTETRWLAQAAARYLLCCTTPLYALLLIGMATAPACRIADGCAHGDGGGIALGFFLCTAVLAGPALVLLLLLAPHALRGRPVRTVFALVTSVMPALFLLAGFWPSLLIITAQSLYAWAALPVTGPPARADRAEQP